MNYYENIKNILIYNAYANKEYMLENAIIKNSIDVVRLILEHDVDIHFRYDYALRLASDKGHVEIVRLLLDKGADVHAELDSPLRYASKNGNIELIKLFLSKDHNDPSMDKIITENFYDWIRLFTIPLGFKRTKTMEEVERRYLSNEDWIKSNRKPSSNFSDISIIVL